MSDYLWNKKGHDPEIEKLEASLSAFASEKEDPAESPEVEREQNFFSRLSIYWNLVPAFGVLALFAFLFFGTFSNSGDELVKQAVTDQVEKADTNPVVVPAEDVNKPEGTSINELAAIDLPSGKARKPRRKANRIANNSAGRKMRTRVKRKARPNRNKAVGSEVITAEERAAYEQLKKALAITSSNLSILKQKVSGDEEESLPATKE